MGQSIGGAILVLFFVFETVNWFIFQAYRIKLDLQKGYTTQEQAEKVLKHVRLIYFWLSSDYYYSRMREAYYLVYDSPLVSVETKKKLRKSTARRMVRGLKKVYDTEKVS